MLDYETERSELHPRYYLITLYPLLEVMMSMGGTIATSVNIHKE